MPMKLSFLAVLVILAGCSKPAPKLPASSLNCNIQPCCVNSDMQNVSCPSVMLEGPSQNQMTAKMYQWNPAVICAKPAHAGIIELTLCPAPPAPRKKAEKAENSTFEAPTFKAATNERPYVIFSLNYDGTYAGAKPPTPADGTIVCYMISGTQPECLRPDGAVGHVIWSPKQ